MSTRLSSSVEPGGHRQRGRSFHVYAKFLKDGDDAANAKISARLDRRT
ncbi:hypothetical protein [Streptomyces bauhiniae]|nr:hypothetical protein [Streptomyces bauhiniae]